MAGSGVFDACQFESELSFRVAKSFFAFKCRSYRLANLTKGLSKNNLTICRKTFENSSKSSGSQIEIVKLFLDKP